MNKGTPIQESKRLTWIDAARGLAIFGIFMVNMPAFNAPYFMYGGEEKYWPGEVSQAIQVMIDIFFQASFYTLFSFLFGFGMYMMKERLQEKGFSYRPVLFRRLLVLILIGAIHAFFIWHGDILFSYGTIGLLLFAFYERKPLTILSFTVGIFAVSGWFMFSYLYPLRDRLGYINEQAIQSAKESYGNGSLMDILGQNLSDWLYSNGSLFSWIMLTASLLPMFLLGLYIAKRRWLHEIDVHKKQLTFLWWITLSLFISFKAGPYLFGNPAWFQFTFQDRIGGSASALFYVSTIALLYQRRSRLVTVIRPLEYVGRLALSNYLFQSVTCFLLFYSVGLGFYGEVKPIVSLILVIVIFSGQIVGSRWWLSVYQFGLIEWIWRTLTYGKKQPLKRKKEEEKAVYES